MIRLHSRRGLVVALLIGLLAAFTAGGVVHHLADHATAETSATPHGDMPHEGALYATATAACGVVLLLIGLIGLAAGRPPELVDTRRWRRHRAHAGASPGRFVPRRLQRAELQCFLT